MHTRTLLLACLCALALCGLLFAVEARRAAAQSAAPCAVGDVNCDGRLDIVDLQSVAAGFGRQAAATPNGARLDLDGDGVIDLPDLNLAQPAWRTRGASAAGELPRLGYAVDGAGQVFLRWQPPVSPYSETATILRQPAPAGAPPAGRPGAGIVAEVAPITGESTAMPLLGDAWEVLRVAFATETDGDGNQIAVPMQSVAEMHDYARQGANPLVVQQLSSQSPGVAQVFGRGYLDSDFTSTGVYTYWVRIGGRTLGPLRVDTTSATRLPAPGDVLAFEGTANVTGTVGTWGYQSQLRIAHAAVFLTWDASLDRRQSHPVWQNGFNVYRKECNPGGASCGGYTRVNELPVLPRPLGEGAFDTEVVSATGLLPGTQVSFGVESQEFSYYWADRNLNTNKEYCYRVAAIDLLGQDGRLSQETGESCLRPPDYLPPTEVEIIGVAPEHYEGGGNLFVEVRTPPQSNPRNRDLVNFQIYVATSATAAWPDEWDLMGTYDANRREPTHRFLAHQGLKEHEQRWVRVIAVDGRGNKSAPGAPALGTVEDVTPPDRPFPCAVPIGGTPEPGCIVLDADTALINIYRKFGPDGIPLLVEQLPVDAFDWATWQDSYTPAQTTDLSYELRALDEVGNLSVPSVDFVRTLSPVAVPVPSLPVIDAIEWAKDGASYDATIRWSQVNAAGVSDFTVYRSEGSSPPESLAEMTPIQDGIIAILIGLAYEKHYAFTDTGLDPNTLYWYAIEASGPGTGGSMPSEPRASRYIAVGPEPEHPISQIPLTATLTEEGVELRTIGDYCCFIFLRSRDGARDFTAITPLIYEGSYLDTDVRAGEPAFYQVVQIDAGVLRSAALDSTDISGEIVAVSPVVDAAIPPAPTPSLIDPLIPPPQLALPGSAPASLQFGPNWRVQVRRYDAGSTPASASGDGAVQLTVGPGDVRQVWVQFDDIRIDAAGRVLAINPGGRARVEIGATLIPAFADRFTTAFTNMRLDPEGALADLAIIGYGNGMQAWDITPSGPGEPIPAPLPDQRISNPQLEWTRQVDFHLGQTCSQAPDTIALPFAIRDWPLYLVPTEVFTLTHSRMQFGATCTLYRDRYSGLDAIGAAIPANQTVAYRNDDFLRPSYGGSGASYGFTSGLSGSWGQSGAHSYTTAWPFGFTISSDSRSFSFADGVFSGGSIGAGSLAFDYARSLSMLDTNRFSGSFTGLTIGPGGAIQGSVSSLMPTEWLTFDISQPDYALYVPAALTARTPGVSWVVAAGAQGSGVPGNRRNNPGLNAADRDLAWTLCPNATLSTATFAENDQSQLDLYARRSGITGRVDFTPAPLIDATVSGYTTQFTRFAYSWLSNLGVTSGIAGNFKLPYPADITLNFDALELDGYGCIAQGDVLPERKTLAYWHVDLIPQTVDLRPDGWSAVDMNGNVRTNYTLWLLGDYDIPNLTQAEGAADSLIEMEASFAPDGTFLDAEIFPEQTVYEVDGFYTVVGDLRLSDYATDEAPAWDTGMTIEQPPGSIDGFIELTAGVYLPYFGEASDPDTAKIYLLGNHTYIGFDERPHAERFLSEQLKLNMAYDLAYAQADGGTASRWLAIATEATRGLDIAGLTIVETPHALIATPEETRLVFGFPAPAALFLAADEAYASWGGRGAGDADRFAGWRAELGMTSSSDLLGDVFAPDAAFAERLLDQNIDDYTLLITELNDALDNSNEPPSWLEDAEVATIRSQIPFFPDLLGSAPTPLHAQYLRGDVVIAPVTDDAGRVVDGIIDQIAIGTYLQVYQNPWEPTTSDPEGASEAKLVEATLTMLLDPQGSVYLGADDVQSSLLAQEVSADVDMRLLFSETLGYGMEGGITLYNLQTPGVEVTRAGAVAGFTLLTDPAGVGLLYVGATLDAQVELASLGRIDLGGSFLYGQLDPGSPVLTETYGDLFDDMDAPAGEIIQGGYFMAYANDIPIYNVGAGCVGVQVSGGGEIALWAFTRAGTSDDAWGMRLGVNAMGEAFCVAVAKADVTLQLDNDFGEDTLDLTGTAWAGAGCGSCEPEDWDSPADVANDSWCLKCVIDLYFKIPLAGSSSKSEFDFTASCPF